MAKYPVIDVQRLTPDTCPHHRQNRWSSTEFVCLDCYGRFRATSDGSYALIPQTVSTSHEPMSLETELGLSWEEARVLHQAKIGTISALRERLDEVLRFRIRNMGKQLQEEILAALDAWEARQPP